MQPIHDFTVANFVANLKFVCSYHSSISDICRKLPINRQQFMKYISGSSFPSRFSLRKLCDFFGFDEHEMLMPHDQFRNIVRLKRIDRGLDLQIPKEIVNLLLKMQRQKNNLSRFVGYYYQYYNSFSRSDCVLRSLVLIYNWNDYTFYKRLERLKFQNDLTVPDVYKYTGILANVGDRLHFMDQECITEHELSHTIVYPSYRNRITTLTGVTMGVSGSDKRVISASPVVLEYVGRGIKLREAIEGCRVYESSSREIPAPILEALRQAPAADHRRAMQVPPLM